MLSELVVIHHQTFNLFFSILSFTFSSSHAKQPLSFPTNEHPINHPTTMRLYAAVLAAMLLVNSSVFAQQVNITYPRQWKSGVTANASWTFNPPLPTTGLSIDLFSWSAPTQDVFAH